MRGPPPVVVQAVALFALGGCAGGPARIEPGPVYPVGLERAGTLDIQVFRDGQHIELTNTTAHDIGPGWLWLNGRYGRPIDVVRVGESRRMHLREFKDEFSEPFRAGGFFATEQPERLVLAELQTSEGMQGLVVVGSEPVD